MILLESLTVISTRDLSRFPGISSLRKRLQQMAAVEAVFAITEGATVFEFHPEWGRSEQMGAIKNGSGDELFAHFTRSGCCIIGFAHESAMSPYRTKPAKLWPGLLSSVPSESKSTLDEPAFDIECTTFAIWRFTNGDAWRTEDLGYSDDAYGDGSQELLALANLTANEFADWLEENYEVDIDDELIKEVFENQSISEAQLSALKPDVSTKKLRAAIAQTGYPVE